jgi:hypothetical protein
LQLIFLHVFAAPFRITLKPASVTFHFFAFMDAESDVPRAKRSHAAHGTILINFGSEKRSYIF